MWKERTRLFWALASMLVLFSGCGLLMGLKRADRSAVLRAAKAEDWVYVGKVCSGETPATGQYVKRKACKLIARRDRFAKLKGVPCSELVSFFESQKFYDTAFQRTAGRRFAECGHYEALFEKVVPWGMGGRGMGGRATLSELEAAGFPLKAKFAGYLATHQGPAFFKLPGKRARFALLHIGKWLLRAKHHDLCAAIAKSATGSSELARVWVLPYFKGAKCQEGAPIARALLSSESPTHRSWACNALGLIGGPQHLTALQTLAETDPHTAIRETRRAGRIWALKVRPVREACRAAQGKIKLRQ